MKHCSKKIKQRSYAFLQGFCLVLRGFDFFGHPIHLKYKEEDEYTTKCGGFFSVVMIILIISFFYGVFLSYVNKDSVTVTEITEYSNDPPLI